MKQDFCTGYSNYRNNGRIVMATPGYASDMPSRHAATASASPSLLRPSLPVSS
jgi:hypothetical protein